MARKSLHKTGIAILVALLGLAGACVAASSASAASVDPSVVAFSAEDIEYSATSPDDSLIAYSDYSDDQIILLEVASGTTQIVADAGADIDAPGQLVFTSDGSTIYVPSYTNDDILVIDVATASVTGVLSSTPGFNGPWTLAISADDSTLYVGNYDGDEFSVFNISLATDVTISSVGYPYAMFVSPDGATVYNMDYYGDIDVIDVSNPAAPSVVSTWSNVTGEFYSACVDSSMSTLYMPDKSSSTLYAVSLSDGSITNENDATNPNGVSNYSCSVSPDGSSVFVSDYDAGSQLGGGLAVTAPGLVTEYSTTDLSQIAEYSFAGVAYTQMINFYSVCDSYVAGYYGNAQKLTLDTGMCAPALPDTGFNATQTALGYSAGGVMVSLGAVALALVRRRKSN